VIATGIGSLPGTDMRGSLAAMAETFDQLIPLPELPAPVGTADGGRSDNKVTVVKDDGLAGSDSTQGIL
jgi:hypothetical protein